MSLNDALTRWFVFLYS